MRSIVLANGNMMVGLDLRGQVRDFYFPYIGLENHTGGKDMVHRLGVFADGRMEWFDSGSWNIAIDYDDETMASHIAASNEALGVEVVLNDVIYNEKNIFVRGVTVNNTRDEDRFVKMFFHHEFKLSEANSGDTAYYDPETHAIVHYKGRRAVLLNAVSENNIAFDDHTVGIFGIEGKEGSFKDAEDGMLSQNAIEHGSVDSVIGITLALEKGSSRTVWYWACAGETMKEAKELNGLVLKKTPGHILETTKNYWKAWVNRRVFTFHGLPETTAAMFKKSLLIMRAHCDDRGGILASSDSDMLNYGRDTYSYIWPRDASRIALAFVGAGDPEVAKKFFEFSAGTITENGYMLHKYRPDASLGSSWHPWVRDGKPALPIQEDETALILVSLKAYYDMTRDLEFIEKIYERLIEKAARFMIAYRDPDTGLPRGSYDLWEEKYGAHTYTAATVAAALAAAAFFAELLGKHSDALQYRDAAERMRRAIPKHLYNNDTRFFQKSAIDIERGAYDETVDSSSMIGVVEYGILPPDHDLVLQSLRTLEERLCCHTALSGLPRYENDRYYRVDEKTPGNPWIVTTMWFAQYHLMRAQNENDLAAAKHWIAWAAEHALPSGVMSEQLHPHTGELLSAAPLVWSHAEFVITVTRYLQKLEELGICKDCNPVS